MDDGPEKPKEEEDVPMRPPIRPRTAYAFFIKRHFREFMTELGTNDSKAVLRQLAEAWRNLPDDFRKYFVQLQVEDRQRYAQEKEKWDKYFHGRPPKIRQRKRDFDAPKRTMNAFLYYERAVWKKVRDSMHDMSQRELVIEIARRWRKLSPEEKLPYIQKSETDKKRFQKEKAEYMKRKKEMCAAERMAILRQRRELEWHRLAAPPPEFEVEEVNRPPVDLAAADQQAANPAPGQDPQGQPAANPAPGQDPQGQPAANPAPGQDPQGQPAANPAPGQDQWQPLQPL